MKKYTLINKIFFNILVKPIGIGKSVFDYKLGRLFVIFYILLFFLYVFISLSIGIIFLTIEKDQITTKYLSQTDIIRGYSTEIMNKEILKGSSADDCFQISSSGDKYVLSTLYKRYDWESCAQGVDISNNGIYIYRSFINITGEENPIRTLGNKLEYKYELEDICNYILLILLCYIIIRIFWGTIWYIYNFIRNG